MQIEVNVRGEVAQAVGEWWGLGVPDEVTSETPPFSGWTVSCQVWDAPSWFGLYLCRSLAAWP